MNNMNGYEIVMKELLEKDYIVRHNISSRGVTVVPEITGAVDFDLKDDFPIKILPLGMGQLSIHNEKGNLKIIHYENFVNQCKRPASFLRGRSKCDFILTCIDNHETVLLIEMTSALGSVANLKKAIIRETDGATVFPGGKFEKCEHQLYSSLKDLMDVHSISVFMNAYSKRVCLMAYKIEPYKDTPIVYPRPYSKYLQIESRATSDNGAIIPCPLIEALGFEYRRIEHSYVFSI